MLAVPIDLPSKKYLNLSALKCLAAAAEAEAGRRNVQVTLCIVDDGGNLLYLQKADGVGHNTVAIARKKARYAAIYRRSSKIAADQLKDGGTHVLALPDGFPLQGGLPVVVAGEVIGAMSASGAASDVDEAIVAHAIDTLLRQ